jgi:multidrug efflux system membrane fusion protein
MNRAITQRAAAAVGCAIAGTLFAMAYWLSGTAGAEASPRGPALVPVEAVRAARADLSLHIDAIGTAQGARTATVTTRVDGQLQKIAFVEGSQVKAGDLLAQIDPKPYQAQLEEAQAKLAQDEAQLLNARHDVQRYTMLSPEDYTSKQTLDTARSQVAQLTAQVKADHAAIEAAKTQLDYTSIVAPFGGRTGLRLVDEGNIVRASDTGGIVVVTELQPIAVVFTVPQTQLPEVIAATSAGPLEATALADDGKTQLDRGTVSLIDNRVDPATGTVRLKAIFPNASLRLWPGQFVNVRVLTRVLHSVLTTPSTAISQGPNGPFTYVVQRDGTVDLRPVTVARDTGAVAQVTAGLNEGDTVVTGGQYRLTPGAHARVLAPAPQVAALDGPAATMGTP